MDNLLAALDNLWLCLQMEGLIAAFAKCVELATRLSDKDNEMVARAHLMTYLAQSHPPKTASYQTIWHSFASSADEGIGA